MRKVSYFLLLIIFLSIGFISSHSKPAYAQDLSETNFKDSTCIVYFTGVGCPHCAKTDPVILGSLLKENPDLIIIEYEIYQQRENSSLILEYNQEYNSGLGIPLVILGKDKYIVGDTPILKNIKALIQENKANPCPLPNGKSVYFSELDINSLPGKPKIWKADKILIKIKDGQDNNNLKSLLTTQDLLSVLSNINYQQINPQKIALSGRYVEFENAIETNNWRFQWNGEKLPLTSGTSSAVSTGIENSSDETMQSLTFSKILSLAIVDSVNPCALAVLTLMLLAILTYSPKNRKNIILAGGAFVLSVFLMYLFYGLIIIKFFQVVQALTSVRLYLYKILGGVAIILGLLNIKDFVRYKAGGLFTEMPLFLRPKVKQIISGITSPKGAFAIGLCVTLFLLPCTIGPYVIAGGILSFMNILKTIPWLLFYNLVFVLPMIVIVFLIYLGTAKIEDVSEWKEKNIKYLHLVAGLIMFGLGIGMILGFF